jgi:hypothetical protein
LQGTVPVFAAISAGGKRSRSLQQFPRVGNAHELIPGISIRAHPWASIGRETHSDIVFGKSNRCLPKGDETRLASPCNIWAKALGDVKTLGKVRAGAKIKVSAAD